MITELQYEALRRYKDGPQPVPPGGLSPVDTELLSMGLIEKVEYTVSSRPILPGRNLYSVSSDLCRITPKGTRALSEFEASRSARRREDRRRFLRDLLIGLACAAVGALAGWFFAHL